MSQVGMEKVLASAVKREKKWKKKKKKKKKEHIRLVVLAGRSDRWEHVNGEPRSVGLTRGALLTTDAGNCPAPAFLRGSYPSSLLPSMARDIFSKRKNAKGGGSTWIRKSRLFLIQLKKAERQRKKLSVSVRLSLPPPKAELPPQAYLLLNL